MALETVQPSPHHSVLLREALTALNPQNNGIYVDGTFGAGGHSAAILNSAECQLVAIDQDPTVEEHVERLSHEFGARFTFIEGNFENIATLCAANDVDKVDGVLLDIGVSSMQIDQAERGFSFMHDGPLDMRMSAHGQTAAEWIAAAPEEEIADVIYRYGDERKSRRIARAIKKAQEHAPIVRTGQLADIIKQSVGRYNDTIHPATRSFQAIRIFINDELGVLERGIIGALSLLKVGGRLAVITFHSGEDRIVKQMMNDAVGKAEGVSRYVPVVEQELKPEFKLVSRKAIAPSDEEIKENVRARSAKLRVIERVREG